MSCRPRPREKLSWEEARGCWEAAPPQESQLRLERDQKYSSSPGPGDRHDSCRTDSRHLAPPGVGGRFLPRGAFCQHLLT